MELRKINNEDAKAQWEYTTALPEDENGLTNPYNGVSYDEYIALNDLNWQSFKAFFKELHCCEQHKYNVRNKR